MPQTPFPWLDLHGPRGQFLVHSAINFLISHNFLLIKSNRKKFRSESITSIPTIKNDLYIITGLPSRVEITMAIKTLKNGKAAGPDCIPPET